MVRRESPRELEHEIEQLKDADDAPEKAVTVAWRDAAPEDRPHGMGWTPGASRLAFDFSERQRAALDALGGDADLVALLGGYRSGKSVTGARWLLTQALEYPGTRHLAMGIDFAKAQGATYRVLFEQLPAVDVRTDLVTSHVNGPERSPLVADYNRSEHRLTLTNDSVIKLGAADVWNRYAGDEYAGVWLDEPSHYSDLHAILEMIGSRLTAPTGPKTQLWTLTGNGYNAAWEILEKREDAAGDPIGLDIDVVTASIHTNPYLSEEDVDRLERQFTDTGREEQALAGGFAAATGLVYSDFSRDTHVIPQDEAERRGTGAWRIYGYDAGWNDPRVVLEVGRTDYGQLVVLDEFHAGESHVEDAVAWLADRPEGTVFCEHEPADIEKFKRAGRRAQRADKSIDAGIDEVRRRLATDDEDRVGLLVAEDCRHTIREFLGYQEEDVGGSRATDHCLDALRYAIMGEAHGESGAATATARVGDVGGDRNDGKGINLNEVARQVGRQQKRRQRGNQWK
jgi:hypothetical protein